MYYLVKAKCGHVGRGKYIEKNFPIYANSKKEAARIVLNKARVKKHLKDAIISIIEINESDFIEYVEINSNDLYLHSHSKIYNSLFLEEIKSNIKSKKNKYEFICRKERINYKKKKENLMEDYSYGYVYL